MPTCGSLIHLVASLQAIWSSGAFLLSPLTQQSFCKTVYQVNLGLLLETLPTIFIHTPSHSPFILSTVHAISLSTGSFEILLTALPSLKVILHIHIAILISVHSNLLTSYILTVYVSLPTTVEWLIDDITTPLKWMYSRLCIVNICKWVGNNSIHNCFSSKCLDRVLWTLRI